MTLPGEKKFLLSDPFEIRTESYASLQTHVVSVASKSILSCLVS